MVKIIGFTGTAFAGKDTAASIIVKNNKNTETLAFASPIKDACKILFNLTDAQLHTNKEQIDERWGLSPRQIFQIVGTDLLRNQVNKDIFIINMKQRIDKSKADVIIVTDIRFDNEVKLVRSLGGKIVKIVRHSYEGTKHSEHISENGISENIDYIISNSSTIEEFENKVMSYFNADLI